MIQKLFFLLSIFYNITYAQSPNEIARLEKSPRHQEWMNIAIKDRSLKSFIVYPEVKKNAPVVIIIHENRGLTDWVRGMGDVFAEKGCISICPDLLSGAAPNRGNTSDFRNQDEARDAIYALKPEQVTESIKAVYEYAKKIPSFNGKIIIVGYCWGGSQTFRFATNEENIEAALVFYGTAPTSPEEISKIRTKVYGFYGENDNRINATISKTQKLMYASGKFYEPVIYKGAGHGFMRTGEEVNATIENLKAKNDAWQRIDIILKTIK